MSKNRKSKKQEEKKLSMVPFLYMGIFFVFVTAILQSVWAGFPEWLRNLLYLFGIISLVVYMFQIAFEKRTGKSETDGEPAGNRLKSGK